MLCAYPLLLLPGFFSQNQLCFFFFCQNYDDGQRWKDGYIFGEDRYLRYHGWNKIPYTPNLEEERFILSFSSWSVGSQAKWHGGRPQAEESCSYYGGQEAKSEGRSQARKYTLPGHISSHLF